MGYTSFSFEKNSRSFAAAAAAPEYSVGMLKGRIAHGASLVLILIFCKRLSSPPSPFPAN
jgi:hypothetical protein